MRWKWGRIAVAAVTAEVLPILALFGLVALLGPGEPAAAEQYAARLGRWVGPIGGGVAVFLGAVWVGRGLPAGQVAHGVAVGAATAAIDGALLAASGTGFEWLFVASQGGRVAAGALGGWVARRMAGLVRSA